MNSRTIAALMISAASMVAISPATAADMPVKARPAVPLAVATGFFGYIEGMYVIEPGDAAGQYPNVAPLHPPAASPGDGIGGAFLIGYRFAGPWDVAVGMHHTRFSDGGREVFPACAPAFNQMTKPRMTSADGSVGYNVSTDVSATRIHAGVRYAHWKHHLTDTCNGQQNDAETNAIGPRIGLDHSFKAGSNLTMLMGGSGSLLFADVENTVRTLPGGALIASGKDDRLVFHAGAHVALGWQIAPLMNLAAGYKIDIWHGMISEQAGFSAATVGRGRANVIEHGPFVRASYNFGVR